VSDDMLIQTMEIYSRMEKCCFNNVRINAKKR